MSLDELDSIITQLEERKSIQPNISTIWLNYLLIKKQKLEEAILDTKTILNYLNTTENDLSFETIMFLWTYMSSIRENTI